MGAGEELLRLGELEELARTEGWLQRVDARAKLVTTLAYLVVVVSLPKYDVESLLALASYPAFLVGAGRIPARLVGRRVCWALPVAVAMAGLNPLWDRTPLALTPSLKVAGGWVSLATTLCRLLLTVSAVVGLVATTGIARLCGAMRRLGVPWALTMQVGLLYRYLSLCGEEGLRMQRAAQVRGLGKKALPMKTFGPLVGHLLLRSLERATRIHWAMQSRGFSGQLAVLHHGRLTVRDIVFVLSWLAVFGLVRWGAILMEGHI